MSSEPSSLMPYIHQPEALAPFMHDGTLDKQAYMDAERRRHPRPSGISPPLPWQSTVESTRSRASLAFYGFEIAAFILLVGFVGVLTWNAVSVEAPDTAPAFTLAAMLAVGGLIGAVVIYRRGRFRVIADRGGHQLEETRLRMVHESTVLDGVVTHAKLNFYHSTDRRGYTNFPPDDSLIADITIRYTFTTPDGRQKDGYAQRRLEKYYYGEDKTPDPARVATIKEKYTSLYGDITGAPVYVLYLDDRNFRLL